MKPKFRNHYAQGISKPLSQIQNAFLSVSSIGTGISLAAVLIALIYPSANYQTHPYLWAVLVVVGISIGTYIDFVLIKKLGKFAFSELFAWISGGFANSIHRKTNTVLFTSIALFAIAVSFVTSYDGSRLAASMAPPIKTISPKETINGERKAVSEAVKPYLLAVKNIETKIGETVKTRTNSKLLELAKGGNVWAKNEILSIQAAVEKQYSKELTAAKNNLKAAQDREEGRADIAIQTAVADATNATKLNEKREGVVWNMLALLGVLPLIFGVLLLVVDANNNVIAELPEKTVTQNGKINQVGQRQSDDFDKIYNESGGGKSNP